MHNIAFPAFSHFGDVGVAGYGREQAVDGGDGGWAAESGWAGSAGWQALGDGRAVGPAPEKHTMQYGAATPWPDIMQGQWHRGNQARGGGQGPWNQKRQVFRSDFRKILNLVENRDFLEIRNSSESFYAEILGCPRAAAAIIKEKSAAAYSIFNLNI